MEGPALAQMRPMCLAACASEVNISKHPSPETQNRATSCTVYSTEKLHSFAHEHQPRAHGDLSPISSRRRKDHYCQSFQQSQPHQSADLACRKHIGSNHQHREANMGCKMLTGEVAVGRAEHMRKNYSVVLRFMCLTLCGSRLCLVATGERAVGFRPLPFALVRALFLGTRSSPGSMCRNVTANPPCTCAASYPHVSCSGSKEKHRLNSGGTCVGVRGCSRKKVFSLSRRAKVPVKDSWTLICRNGPDTHHMPINMLRFSKVTVARLPSAKGFRMGML